MTETDAEEPSGGGGAETGQGDRRFVLRVLMSAPRPVWVLVIGVFLNRSGAFFATFLTLFLQEIGFSLQQIPLILVVVGVAMPTGSMLGGWAADRFGRKTTLIGCTLMASGSFLVIGLAPGQFVALTGVFGAALFAQAYLPAASALLVDHTEERDRVPVFALFRLALNLGATLGPLLAAAVSTYGIGPLFLVSSAAGVVFVLVLSLGLPSAVPPGTAGTAGDTGSGRSGRGTAEIGLVVFMAAVLCVTAVYAQYSSSVSLSVADDHGTRLYALMLTASGALIILCEIPLSSITRRLPWHIPVTIGTVLMAGGIALAGAFQSLLLIMIGVVVWTVGEMLYSPVVSSAVASLSPPERVGRYQGYLGTVQAAAFSLGPALGTWTYGTAPGALWVGCLVVGAIAAGAFLTAGRWARSSERTRKGEVR